MSQFILHLNGESKRVNMFCVVSVMSQFILHLNNLRRKLMLRYMSFSNVSIYTPLKPARVIECLCQTRVSVMSQFILHLNFGLGAFAIGCMVSVMSQFILHLNLPNGSFVRLGEFQ